ncbi:MAG: FAD-dependent oxidoreductase [Actinomycetota bacterium]
MSAVRTTAEAFASGGRSDLVALDVSSAAWVDTLEAEPEAADYLRAFLAAMGGTTLERTSVLPLLWDMVELDYTPADAFLDLGELFTDGTKSLIDAMAAHVDVRFETVVTHVVHDDQGVIVTLADGATLRAGAAIVALPLNVWADVQFDPPLASAKQRAAAERHPGEVSKVLAVVAGAPTSYLGAGWGTPINAGFVTKPAGEHRLFVGFSVQDRLDLSDQTRSPPR